MLHDWIVSNTARLYAGLPEYDICWFLQTIYTTPTGIPLSINSSLSTVRCNISVLLTFMLTQLESSLLDKELDCYKGHVSEGSCLHLLVLELCQEVTAMALDTTCWPVAICGGFLRDGAVVTRVYVCDSR